jgi:hypothetical protein
MGFSTQCAIQVSSLKLKADFEPSSPRVQHGAETCQSASIAPARGGSPSQGECDISAKWFV